MEKNPILYEKRNKTAWIYLNEPEAMNAMNKNLLHNLTIAIEKAEEDHSIRVIVLTGKEKAFCAGADLKELSAGLKDKSTNEQSILDLVESSFDTLSKVSKPLIAALNGTTLAGGLELAMTADFILAADQAKIGDAHSNFGVIPGAGGAVKLPRRIGVNRAKYLLYTGDFISAAEMREYGLVQEVVEAERLEERVQEIADKLAEKSPLVLRRMKELVADGLEQPLDIALKQELLSLKLHTKSYDFKEGLTAFTEKRKPEFKGY